MVPDQSDWQMNCHFPLSLALQIHWNGPYRVSGWSWPISSSCSYIPDNLVKENCRNHNRLVGLSGKETSGGFFCIEAGKHIY